MLRSARDTRKGCGCHAGSIERDLL